MNRELEVEVFGRVQGIGFRRTVKGWAGGEGVKGFVVNQKDGSVLIVAQESVMKLQKLLGWLNQGPGFSKIDSLKYSWRKPIEAYEGFEIKQQGSFIGEQTRNFVNLAKSVFSKKLTKVPKHIAIIPDGNRRWAKGKGLSVFKGHHKAGSLENVKSLVREADKLGVEVVSAWGFSTENWKRSKGEQDAIFKLVLDLVNDLEKDVDKDNLRIKHIGRRDRLPKDLVRALEKVEKNSAKNDGMTLMLCLDYGGRDEILRAVNKVAKKGKKITEEDVTKNLDTAGVPDVDLIIRTSGEKRTSGFMPWQSAYSEFYFIDKHFPDFTARDLRKAVEDFGNRKRRFGGN